MKSRVVTFHYTLKNKAGEILDRSPEREPLTYVEGGGQIIKGLESLLKVMNAGEKRELVVKASEAYGLRDESLVRSIDKSEIPPDMVVTMGDQIRWGSDPKQARIYTVLNVKESSVQLDGNHPLAGQDLYFEVDITHTREPTPEELKRRKNR